MEPERIEFKINHKFSNENRKYPSCGLIEEENMNE